MRNKYNGTVGGYIDYMGSECGIKGGNCIRSEIDFIFP